MNTDNGALEFEAYINNERLNSTALEAERRIKGLSNSAVKESQKMDDAFSGIGKTIAMIGGTAAIGMLGKSILDTTAKFEKFGIVLRNTLGDAAGNDALSMIADFAATTPFQLDEVTGAFIKMANQGFVPTRSELVKLGDLASSTGKSFDQLGEALLDAQTGQFERLKEFGIKASANGDKVTFSFKEQQTTVDNTNSAIQAYILSLGDLEGVAGANAKISASLTGQISNLEDKLAAMYNTIGSANSGFLYAAVGGASTLIENYEIIGKVLVGLVATYGAHTAAVIIATSATKGYTIANQIEYGWLVMVEKAQMLLNKTMLANPYVLATVAVTALISGLVIYMSTLDKVSQAEKSKKTIQDKVANQYGEQKDKIEMLLSTLRNEKVALDQRRDALKELQGIIPGYHASLTTEGKLINDNKTAIDEYLKSLEKEIYLQATKDEKIELTRKKRLQEKELAKKEQNAKDAEAAASVQVVGSGGIAGTDGRWMLAAQAKGFANKAKEELQATVDAIKAIDEEYVKVSNSMKPAEKKDPVSETPAQKKARLKQEAKEQKDQNKLLDDYNKEKSDAQKKADEAELALIRSRITDKKDLIDIEYEQTLKSIKEQEDAYLAAAKKAGVKNPSTASFDSMRTTAKAQAVTDKQAIDTEDAKVAKQKYEELLTEFATYEERRAAISKEYADKRAEAEKNGNLKLANEIMKAENEALSKLASDMVMASPDWTKLFGDLDKVSVAELIKIKDKIEAQFKDLNLMPDDLKALRDKLNEVTQNISKKNPFAALSESIKKYKNDKSDDNLKDVFKSTSGSIDAVKGVFDQVTGSLDKMGIKLDDSTKQVVEGVSGMMGGASELAMGIATGNPMQIIQGSIDLISNGMKILDAGSVTRNKKLQEEIEYYNKIVEVYDTLIAKQKQLTETMTGTDAFKSYQEAIEMINSKTIYAKKSLDDWFKMGASISTHSNWYKYDRDLGNVLSRQELLTMSAEEWTAFMKDHADIWAKLPDEVKAYAQEVMEAKDQTSELTKAFQEATAGFSLDSATSSILDLASQADLTFKSISGNFSKLMQDSISRLIKSQFVDEEVKKWYQNFVNDVSDGNLTDAEVKARQDEFEKIVQQANEKYKQMIEAAGISLDSTSNSSALSGAVQGVSEETAGILSGQINAMRINQIESISVLRNSLLALNKIADNTSYNINLVGILRALEKLVSNSDSLRAQGQ